MSRAREINIDSKKIFKILRRKLILTEEDRNFFPAILRTTPYRIIENINKDYFSLTFIDNLLESKIKKYRDNLYDTFPGLIKPREIDEKTFYKINNSKNLYFHNIEIKNMYSFDLGPDSSLLLENYSQSIESEKLGKISYTIDLSYIISFGDEINDDSFYDYLEQLFSYSINIWRSQSKRT